MLFNDDQIREMLDIIDFQHLMFIGENVGEDVLTKDDYKLLNRHGIKPDSFQTEHTPFHQSYLFGKLSSALGDKNAKTLKYNDFLKYLRRGQYDPLTSGELETIKYLKQHTYSHVKGLGDKMKQTVNGIIVEEDHKLRMKFEGVIKRAILSSANKREGVKAIISAIGNKTGDWQRDLGRIADTEMQTAFEIGRAMDLYKRFGGDCFVYKEVFPLACRHCIRLYLTSGIGSEPRKFRLSELIGNGTNIDKKVAEWKAVVGAVHPWCRCILVHWPDNKVWDKEMKMLVYKKAKIEIPKVKLTVGDKEFWV